MKDGFYLSTYIEIDDISNIYEFGQRHDQNISLWRKVGKSIELIHYWELERITGEKQHRTAFYDKEHAVEVINKLLKPYKLSVDDMLEIWGTPLLDTNDDYHSLDCYPDLSYHSIAHLFSSIMLDTDIFYNENILSIALDGGPDQIVDKTATKKSFYSACYSQKGNIDVFRAASPCALWFAASNHYKLREGTLMALAYASNSKAYLPAYEPIMIYDGDNKEPFEFFRNLVERIHCLEAKDAGVLFNGFDDRFTEEENKASMVMKVIQEMSIKIVEKNIDMIIKRYNISPKETYFSMSGGYALNCPTNTYIMSKYEFKGFIAPTCVNDSGMSMGIALYAFYKKNKALKFKLNHSYYGDNTEALTDVLENGEFNSFIKSITKVGYKQIVQDITTAPIVWINERTEIGPRALGNRSIIADPRFISSKDALNNIKGRQWWRPVAPIVMEEEGAKWFENYFDSPYMLNVFKVKEDKLELVPAIAHMNESARIQTVNAESNLRIYELLKAFKAETGVPILCNTSLNDKGEPIINRIEEAFNFALRKSIKIMYINGIRVELCNHQSFNASGPGKRYVDVKKDSAEIDLLKKNINPHDVDRNILIFYVYMRLHNTYDLKKKTDARELTVRGKSFFRSIGTDIIGWN